MKFLKGLVSIITNPLILCFILVICIATTISLIVQEPTWWILMSLIGIPAGLLIRYLLNKKKKN